jgi:uncharacterized integral membrane protein
VQEPDRDREGPAEAPARRDTATVVKVIAGLIVLILFIVFVGQNSDTVTVNFVFFSAEVRLIWVFVACALIGMVIGYLLARPGRRASKRYIRELERRVEEGRKKD